MATTRRCDVLPVLLLLLLAAALIGCGSTRPREDAEEAEYADAATGSADESIREVQSLSMDAPSSYAKAERAAPKRARMQAMMAEPAPAPAAAPPQGAPPPQEAQPAAKPDRMIHYEGNASLRSTEPEKALDSAVAIVK